MDDFPEFHSALGKSGRTTGEPSRSFGSLKVHRHVAGADRLSNLEGQLLVGQAASVVGVGDHKGQTYTFASPYKFGAGTISTAKLGTDDLTIDIEPASTKHDDELLQKSYLGFDQAVLFKGTSGSNANA